MYIDIGSFVAWLTCHLTTSLIWSLSGTLETSWTREALVIYCVGVKDVWSCALQFSECCTVLVADAISYGFPSSKRFASDFVPSSLVKQQAVVCKWSIHSITEQCLLLRIFSFCITLHTLLFIDRVFPPSLQVVQIKISKHAKDLYPTPGKSEGQVLASNFSWKRRHRER